ncbi:hypothetical protein IGS68_33485 (plasmid) [Skermanella sp. TT6]|uniref:Uncharacterized protein n=1 Tax=Skermanella cutis TaxID=2775420 RepID=A0ABX7BGM6_9PROT|nr:hypothetical protein [Skermanella sp. TT6]QQP93535.1 hypothetical protein IGS68_33485 [Skermanella sp. TT6]
MSRRRKYRHSRATIAKIRDTMRQIQMLLEQHGSYRAKTSGRIITRLGNPHGAEHLRGRGNREAMAAKKTQADAFALSVAPVIEEIRRDWTSDAPPTLRQFCDELALRDVRTCRGGIWSWRPATVKRLLERIARLRQP